MQTENSVLASLIPVLEKALHEQVSSSQKKLTRRSRRRHRNFLANSNACVEEENCFP